MMTEFKEDNEYLAEELRKLSAEKGKLVEDLQVLNK